MLSIDTTKWNKLQPVPGNFPEVGGMGTDITEDSDHRRNGGGLCRGE